MNLLAGLSAKSISASLVDLKAIGPPKLAPGDNAAHYTDVLGYIFASTSIIY
jgi:hypothetical protein